MQKNAIAIASSRISALSDFATLEVQIGSNLIDQFKTSYISLVFCTSLQWCVGGPDCPQQPRWRRQFEDAELVSLDTYTAMMAARCEYQIRADWDLNPGLWSLSFASKVNLGLSMSIKRALRRGAQAEDKDEDIGAATVRIYKLLWDGEYMNAAGHRVKVNGDISKIGQIIGLGVDACPARDAVVLCRVQRFTLEFQIRQTTTDPRI